MLDIAMPQQAGRALVSCPIGQRVAASVPEHVNRRLTELRRARPLGHASKASGGEGAPRSEVNTKGALGLLLALNTVAPGIVSEDRMHWRAALTPALCRTAMAS